VTQRTGRVPDHTLLRLIGSMDDMDNSIWSINPQSDRL
jgi:hypothetical protein